MSEFDYDLFVIGAGSGGVRCARMASTYGAKVAVAEEYRVGGTCVIRGCVPKKLMVYASKFAHDFEDSAGFGWSVDEPSFDWSKLISRKDAEIDRLNGLYIKNLERNNVEIIQTRAEIVGPNSVRLLGENRTVSARHILIATGGVPNELHVPGKELMITSNEVFHLEEKPDRVVVVGAGYIALEFACIFHGLGSEVTVLYRGDEILRGFDEDIRTTLHEEMEKRGITIHCHDEVDELTKTDDGIRVKTTAEREIMADQVLCAIGRSPNSNGLGLETAGVEISANGAIKVDEHNRTNVDHIFAVGDVIDRVTLTPVAIREGAALAETFFNGNPTTVDYENIATAVFTQPEIGTVGMTEAEARVAHENLDIYLAKFRPMKNTLAGNDEKMLMKVIVDADNDKVLGCHILGPDSGEMSQLLGIAIKMGATKADFDATMAVHPTAAEELVTMKEPTSRIRKGA
ncbi:NADPH-glutathione reductase [Cohaesibacter sp. ES.047]|uniref:glutathione-disulfide reductase n=1 Tax=Cohaesibacter sp. ES.047 TaxID=1798205 RepID=UPI000BB692B1|nr:glutathione-disulfide reductase [Cohaesibacter sp. ES.047]SNY93044.1 NADPH-glutathione reductase [Cohaesibacter sp. ES.047]